jgi:hypothetical protein
MKEKKIKTAVYCLLGSAIIQIVSTGYIIFQTLKYKAESMKLIAENPGFQVDLAAFDIFNFSTSYTAIMLVLIFYIVKALRSEKAWAWLGAIIVFVLTAASFAVPLSVIGLIALLDERVRAEFLPKLDIKL